MLPVLYCALQDEEKLKRSKSNCGNWSVSAKKSIGLLNCISHRSSTDFSSYASTHKRNTTTTTTFQWILEADSQG